MKSCGGVTARGICLRACLLAALAVIPGGLAGCQSASTDNSGAASRIASQIASSSPLYIRGEYGTGAANEAWIETLPASAASMHLPANAGCDYLKSWLHQHGGIDSSWSDITIVLRARRKVSVVITAAESVVLRRSPAPAAPYTLTCVPDSQSFVAQEEELGWPNATPGFRVDSNHYLGTPWQPAHYQPGAYSFQMNPGAEQYLGFTGFASKCNCSWGVELHLTLNGKPENVLVQNGSSPFQTDPGPAYPDDSPGNGIWCVISNRSYLMAPNAAKCPPPTTYEERAVY